MGKMADLQDEVLRRCRLGIVPVLTVCALLTGLDVYRPSQFIPSGTNTQAYRFTSTFTDLDRDGRPDLAIAGDFQTSQVFWNNGDGTFTEGTATTGVGTGQDAMGMTISESV